MHTSKYRIKETMASEPWDGYFFKSTCTNGQIHTEPRLTCTYHMAEITGTVLCVYVDWSPIRTPLIGWKGSVTHGLGADISLPPYLSTGDRYLKFGSTTRPKSWGWSVAPRLEVLLSFSSAYGNLVLSVLCLRMHTCRRTEAVIIVYKTFTRDSLK